MAHYKLIAFDGREEECRKMMAGRLTTHVLDTASGKPAAGLSISLFSIKGEARIHLKHRVDQ